MSDITQILSRIESGDGAASAELLPLVYDELRKLAAAKLAHERPGQTLQATALVHEAYLRLVGGQGRDASWDNRRHFLAAAAEAMRRILIENARRRQQEDRGGGWRRVAWDEAEVAGGLAPEELLVVDDALEQLATLAPEVAAVFKLRYFAGLSVEDAAASLGISRASGYRHWTFARAWLAERLGPDRRGSEREGADGARSNPQEGGAWGERASSDSPLESQP